MGDLRRCRCGEGERGEEGESGQIGARGDLRGRGVASRTHSRVSCRAHGCAQRYGTLQADLPPRHAVTCTCTPACAGAVASRPVTGADLKLWAQKWRHYERNTLPWNRALIHAGFARRRSFARWPVHGNVLELLREGRLELGEHVLLEPGVWLTAPAPGPHPHRRRHVPQPRRPGRCGRARRDRRALHVRQRLLRHRRQPPLRRSQPPGPVAGVLHQGPDARSAATYGVARTSSSPAGSRSATAA